MSSFERRFLRISRGPSFPYYQVVHLLWVKTLPIFCILYDSSRAKKYLISFVSSIYVDFVVMLHYFFPFSYMVELSLYSYLASMMLYVVCMPIMVIPISSNDAKSVILLLRGVMYYL